MNQFFPVPFAFSGDTTPIPVALDPSGLVSFTSGYGFDYERDRTSDPDAKAIERQKMNYLFLAITTALRDLQTLGAPEWITSANNGGTPFEYDVAAVVRHNSAVWESLVTANDTEPGTDPTKWVQISGGATIRAANAGGTAEAITAAYTPPLPSLSNGALVYVRAGAANATATPTFAPDGLTAKVIVKGANAPLVAGDVAGSGAWLALMFNATLDRWVLLNPYRAPGSVQTIWIPASAMTPRETSGAAPGLRETATNRVMIPTLDFDPATEEYAQFSVRMPKSWNRGALSAYFVWDRAGADVGAVLFRVQSLATNDGDLNDSAFGVDQGQLDAALDAGDMMVSPPSGPFTPSGTLSAEAKITFQVFRLASNPGDTLPVDARLHGVTILYTTETDTDA